MQSFGSSPTDCFSTSYSTFVLYIAKILKKGKLKELQFSQPSDEELDSYYEEACYFFNLLQEHILELREYFKAENCIPVVRKYRGGSGGSLVFRPLGLTIIMELIEKLSAKHNLTTSVGLVAKLPRNLTEEPLADVIWDTRSHVMVNKGRVLARTLLLYMLGEVKASEKILKSYADALGKELDQTQLPEPI